MKEDYFIDVAGDPLDPPAGTLPGPPKAAGKGGEFVRLPTVWVERLSNIPGADASTYRVAIEILRRRFKAWHKHRPLRLPGDIPGVSRKGRRSALRKLEAAGLIIINRAFGKSPLVTPLHVD